MIGKINRALISVERIDSGRITQHIDLVRKVSELGIIVGNVMKNDFEGFQLEIEVRDDCNLSQTNIALHDLKKQEGNKFVAKNGGHLVFYSRKGYDGYRVMLTRDDRPFLDNERLSNGELIVIRPLRPGTYSVKDTGTGAEGRIQVFALEKESAKQYAKMRESGPIQVETRNKEFDPPTIKLLADQPAVFTATTGMRILVSRLSD